MTITKMEFTNEAEKPQAPVIQLKPRKKQDEAARSCNLCGGKFHPHSHFERFCDQCRVESELYHFAEWLSA